jgi:hypothetical protein
VTIPSVLEHLVHRTHDRAIGEDGFQPEYEIAHHAEANDLIAAGVRRDVAADRAGAPGAEVERE